MSAAYARIDRIDWAATTTVVLPPEAKADARTWAEEVFAIASMPLWVRFLMGLRQALVGLIGIKRGQSDVFDVDEIVDGEAIIVAAEPHLKFIAGVRPDQEHGLLHLVTAVQFRQRRSRLYFVPVRFLHDQVCRSMMTRAITRIVHSPDRCEPKPTPQQRRRSVS